MKTLKIIAIGLSSAAAIALAGCATGGAGTGTSGNKIVSLPATHTTGKVFGGQQPVSGATIQLYAVGITGLQSAATPLVASSVLTGADGGFTLLGDWDCTSNTAAYGVNPELYLVATGGNPGLGAGTNNQALAMIAALGPCNTVTASTNIWVNELTTVAAVYALAPFMADFAHVGSPASQATGIANAFQLASALANSSNGTVPGPTLSAGATLSLAEINTLGNLISSCVNSSGSDGNCSRLFAAATPPSGTAPADTVGALLNVAKHPAANVTALYNTLATTPPFQPALTAVPSDWTVALRFTGGGLNQPAGIAIDAGGNAWVANAGGNAVTELSNTGTLLTGASGYTGSNNIFGAQGIAIDLNGNIWLADTLISSVVELTLSSGVIQSNASFTSGGITGPIALAIDSQNDIWVSNFAGASVTELSNTGSPLGSPLTANNTLVNPYGIAVDAQGNIWVADNSAALTAEFANNQTLLSGAGFTDGGILAPTGISIDPSGNAWIADTGTNAVSLFLPSGSPSVASPAAGTALKMPVAVAIDGAGIGWAANNITAGSIAPLVPATSIAATTSLASLNAPAAIAVDASGNIWTANMGDNSVSEIVGIAVPAQTPLAIKAGP